MSYPTVYARKSPTVFNDIFDAFVNDAWNTPLSKAGAKYDVYTDKKNYYLDFELPGITKENIKVDVEEGVLKITGEYAAAEENKFSYVRRERPVGKVKQSFKLGSDLDSSKIEAKHENGVLHLTIPLQEKAVGKKIEVK